MKKGVKMEEKNSNQTKSGAGLYIVLILLLIIALGAVYYLGYVKNNKEINSLKNEINILKAEKEVMGNEISLLQERNKDELLELVRVVKKKKNKLLLICMIISYL